MATVEALQLEISSLKESRSFLERSRDEAVAKVRDLSIQNQELVLQMKKLKLIDTSRLAGMESELKLKKFELERCSMLLSESEEKYKKVREEKEKMMEKLDIVKDEFVRMKSASEQKICTLKLKMRDKATRLVVYEKLEEELDKIVVQTATLPATYDMDQLVTKFGYGTNIPSSASRRLLHSISLARKVIELENRASELKTSLFKERDERNALQEELDAAKLSLSLSTYPTYRLIELIGKRDVAMRKHLHEISTLKLEITELKKKEEKLQMAVKEIHKYKTDIEQTINHIIINSALETKNEANVVSPVPPPVKTRTRSKVTFDEPKDELSTYFPTHPHHSNIAGLNFTKPLTLTKIPMPKDLMEK